MSVSIVDSVTPTLHFFAYFILTLTILFGLRIYCCYLSAKYDTVLCHNIRVSLLYDKLCDRQ